MKHRFLLYLPNANFFRESTQVQFTSGSYDFPGLVLLSQNYSSIKVLTTSAQFKSLKLQLGLNITEKGNVLITNFTKPKETPSFTNKLVARKYLTSKLYQIKWVELE